MCTLLIDAATFKLVFELEAAVSPAAAGASLSGEQAPTLVSALSLAAGQSAAFFVQALKPSSGVEEEEVVTR